MNSNWSRWTKASFAKHFDALRQTLPLYVDGTDRNTADLVDFAEFRIDGPRIKQVSRKLYTLEVTVNVLVQSTMDDNDAFKIERSIGIMTAAFTPTVLGFRYGNGPDDDQTQYACFQILTGDGQILGFDVRINQFGIIDEAVRKQQATIEGRYRADIREP